MKYKVGDKIRCLKVRGDCEYLIGGVYIISRIGYLTWHKKDCYHVKTKNGEFNFLEDEVELVERADPQMMFDFMYED